MQEIRGKYNKALVMIDELDTETRSQIQSFVNHPALKGSRIVIMPDCHAGKGSVIGFTAKLKDYVIPNMVGVDIGCGIEAFNLGDIDIDFDMLDHKIRQLVPLGFNKRNKAVYTESQMRNLIRWGDVVEETKQKMNDVLLSVGTLGGGNHFIEIDEHDGEKWLVIHSGSRNFGLRICDFHQKKAKALMKQMFIGDAYKEAEFLPMDLGGAEYLQDMKIAQRYAELNRKTIAEAILGYLKVEPKEHIISVHNYIDDEDVIRKGAISARRDQRVIIPLNMRDGVIIGTGKGSNKWNQSAPHGAGRVLSRKQAKKLDLEEFKETMKGIYSTSVGYDTLDESPMAYKDAQLIIDAIGETVDIDFVMKPIYNLKA